MSFGPLIYINHHFSSYFFNIGHKLQKCMHNNQIRSRVPQKSSTIDQSIICLQQDSRKSLYLKASFTAWHKMIPCISLISYNIKTFENPENALTKHPH